MLGADGITYTWGRNEHWQLVSWHVDRIALPDPLLSHVAYLPAGHLRLGGCHPSQVSQFCSPCNTHVVQQGYEVSGLLNSGQSFDAQQEPQAVPIGTWLQNRGNSPARDPLQQCARISRTR